MCNLSIIVTCNQLGCPVRADSGHLETMLVGGENDHSENTANDGNCL
jgi:hypothetical protein